MNIKALILFVSGFSLMLAVTPAYAQNHEPAILQESAPAVATPDAIPTKEEAPHVDILPAKSVSGDTLYVNNATETHPALHLSPDKSELVRLDQEAGTVIVGNPAHLSVMADTSKTLVLIPRLPGATYVTVMDRHGEVIMQRHIIVDGPKEKYMRIRKSCANSESDNCQATQIYYCPDMCHEINITGTESKEGASPEDLAKSISQSTDQDKTETGTAEDTSESASEE